MSPEPGTDRDELTPGPPAVPSARHTVANIDLHGGRLCLDFANTAVWRIGPRPEETLVDYSALLTWSGRTGALTPAEVAVLRRRAAAEPADAAAVVARAIALREVIHLLFVAAIL